uniref:Wsv415-like protein n=1 Tax=Trachysalambria curvirostris nimavirus TaxID=2984282 RepID=A0A9C7CE89_9VIRU|nr:MAG: wsv415-like protein [Trachysalambria curvirostris nimavirus]
MYRHLFSLDLLQANINDKVRASAAAEAIASVEGDGAEFIPGTSPSSKLAGPRYLVLAPDPCEDPEEVYVDVVVKKYHDARSLSPEWEKAITDLHKVGPWRHDPARHLSFASRLDPAPVELPEWQESYSGFARRLTLRSLCLLFQRSGVVEYKDRLFNSIFETPPEIARAAGVMGLANRARFRETSLIEWFFSFDTYSKCIIFLESVCQYLASEASPVMLFLDDIYCEVFSQILRPTYITRVRSAVSHKSLLAPTSDMRLVPVTECIKNFLRTPIVVRDLSATETEYKFTIDDGIVDATPVPSQSNLQAVRKILGQRDGSESESGDSENVSNIDTNHAITIKRKAAPYRGPFKRFSKKSKQADHDSLITYGMIEGYQSGTLSPLNILLRSKPILPHTHNHLLFPVFCSDDIEAEILFFVYPKLTATAALLLPGVFSRRGNYLCGECPSVKISSTTQTVAQSSPTVMLESRLMAPTATATTDRRDVWKYTLADYCPLRHCTGERSRPQSIFANGTRTTDVKHLDVQPLCY